MTEALASILPLAVGIAVSPLPIIAMILTLLSERARANSVGMAVGWVVGVVAGVIVFALLSSFIPENNDAGPRPIMGVIRLALGAVLLVLAVLQWRSRPRPGEKGAMPRWLAAVSEMSPGGAFGLGAVLSSVNPKNLMMGIAAGGVVAGADLGFGETVLVIAVHTVIASSVILVILFSFLAASEHLAGRLERLREWLEQENSGIMAVLFLMLAVSMISNGIQSF